MRHDGTKLLYSGHKPTLRRGGFGAAALPSCGPRQKKGARRAWCGIIVQRANTRRPPRILPRESRAYRTGFVWLHRSARAWGSAKGLHWENWSGPASGCRWPGRRWEPVWAWPLLRLHETAHDNARSIAGPANTHTGARTHTNACARACNDGQTNRRQPSP